MILLGKNLQVPGPQPNPAATGTLVEGNTSKFHRIDPVTAFGAAVATQLSCYFLPSIGPHLFDLVSLQFIEILVFKGLFSFFPFVGHINPIEITAFFFNYTGHDWSSKSPGTGFLARADLSMVGEEPSYPDNRKTAGTEGSSLAEIQERSELQKTKQVRVVSQFNVEAAQKAAQRLPSSTLLKCPDIVPSQ